MKPGKAVLTKLTDLPKGGSIDTLTVSPDGSLVLFTVLVNPSATELTQHHDVSAHGWSARHGPCSATASPSI